MVLLEFIKLLLCVLLSLPLAAHADAHSLCHYFTVNTTARPGQPVCDVQGLIDGNIFLTVACDKTKCIILPGNETHIPDNEEKEMKEIFEDVADTLIKQLLAMNLANFTSRDALSLQARMCCERDATGRKNGSWVFSIGGQKSLLLKTDQKRWKILHSRARWLKTWESDRDMMEFFRKVSMGDCQSWLENFLLNRREMLETTAPPAMILEASRSEATVLRPSLLTLLLLTGLVLLWPLSLLQPLL